MQPEPPPDSIPSPVGTSRFRLGRLRSPQELTAALQSHIVGQEAAIDAAVRALTISAAGLRDPNRPIASLLLVGPTGVGKTELAKQLACQVTGDPDNLCRIDMNTLAQEHYSASLAGAPPGYAGAKEGLTLFDPALIAGNHDFLTGGVDFHQFCAGVDFKALLLKDLCRFLADFAVHTG